MATKSSGGRKSDPREKTATGTASRQKAVKKAAAGKTASRKPAAKQAASGKTAAKKSSSKKSSSKKSAAKKAAPKKASAGKAAKKKTAEKPAGKKTAEKPTKKEGARKPAAKSTKPAAKKEAAKPAKKKAAARKPARPGAVANARAARIRRQIAERGNHRNEEQVKQIKRRKLSAREKEKLGKMLLELHSYYMDQVTALRKESLERYEPINSTEDGTDAFDRQFALTLASNEQDSLAAVEEALRRLDEGVYGICEECGCVIQLSRLKALPFVRNCINCQSASEKGRPHWRMI